jgi:diguanylate cyclase (GGDEF)-like protein
VDALTGLGNHRAFQEELQRQLDLSARHQQPLALVLLDLDNFRTLNEAAGYATGDLALTEVATLMRSVFRGSDRYFRVGGDEFAALLPHAGVQDAHQAARRLLRAALSARTAGPFRDELSFSAGVTGAPEFGTTRVQLIDQAAEALELAKREGRTLVKLYDPDRSELGLDRRSLARSSAAVATLIERRAVHPVYQPIVELGRGRVVAFEGLARPGADSSFEGPVVLFSAAALAGRSVELDRLCLELELAGAGAMHEEQWLSLNVSPSTLESPEFSAAWLAALLDRAGWPAERLVVEVTEREAIGDLELVRRRLAGCQALGVRVAIDDVGAGNAGLRLLSEVPFDVVKIDLSLVRAGARSGASREVVGSIAELARRAGATTIAEGVETAAELGAARSAGITLAQGYLLARPMPTPNLAAVELDALRQEPDLRQVLGRQAWTSATADAG